MAGSERLTFDEVGRLPAPGDNVAIATRRIEAGTRVAHEGSEFTVPHTVLEGHRFAVERIGEGEDLLSWGLTFGQATRRSVPATTRATRRSCACCASATGPPQGSTGTKTPKVPTTRAGAGFREGTAERSWICPANPTSATPSSRPTSWTRKPSGPELRFHRTTSRAPSWATGAAQAVASGRATTSS